MESDSKVYVNTRNEWKICKESTEKRHNIYVREKEVCCVPFIVEAKVEKHKYCIKCIRNQQALKLYFSSSLISFISSRFRLFADWIRKCTIRHLIAAVRGAFLIRYCVTVNGKLQAQPTRINSTFFSVSFVAFFSFLLSMCALLQKAERRMTKSHVSHILFVCM